MVRKYESTQTRKKQIAEAAASIIIAFGSEHVTTKKIAEEVGISETAIYRHFQSKSDLLAFLISEVENTLISEIEPGISAGPFTLATLDAIVKSHIRQVVKRKGISFQVIAEIISLGSKTLNQQTYNVINNYIGRILDILEQGRNAGVIKPEIDLEAAATLFFGMTQGLVNTWALSRYSFDLEKKHAAAWAILRDSIIS
jgi:TetR/AcrR family transcriptional regulator